MSNQKSKNDSQYRCRKVPPSGYETVEVALTKAAAEATRDAWGDVYEIAEAEHSPTPPIIGWCKKKHQNRNPILMHKY